MICWFEAGVTDSFGPQLEGMRDGLGFLPGSACPHWDDEENRRPVYRRLIDEEGFPPGYAADNGVGLHFVGTELVEVLSDRAEGTGYRVEPGCETRLEPRVLALAGGPDPLDGVAALEPERAEQVGGDPSNLADEVCCGEGRVDLQRPRRERAPPRPPCRSRRSCRASPEPARRRRTAFARSRDGRRDLGGQVRIELDRPVDARASTRVLRTARSRFSTATAYSSRRLRSCQKKGEIRAVSRPTATASRQRRDEALGRARSRERLADGAMSRASSAAAMSSSVAASSAKTAEPACLAPRSGFSGTTTSTASPIAPPTSASTNREALWAPTSVATSTARRSGLRHEQRAAADQHRNRHREEDDQPELPRPGPDPPDQDVSDADPHRDSEGQLDHPARPVRHAHSERDQRGDRREEGIPMADHLVREPPGERRRQRPTWATGSQSARRRARASARRARNSAIHASPRSPIQIGVRRT